VAQQPRFHDTFKLRVMYLDDICTTAYEFTNFETNETTWALSSDLSNLFTSWEQFVISISSGKLVL